MPDQSVWIEKMELQGFRVFLQKQTLSLASNGAPLSLAIFGPNARGKSSLVDSIEYYFSSDSTLERLGRRTLQTRVGPIAVEHVDAQDEGINDLVLMSSDNVRPIGLRKCPIRRTLPPQILVSQLCH